MNWTGGALSRSRNAKSKVSLSVKQRNHFAKARVKLQNAQRPSPPAIQYFDFGEWKPESGGVHNDRHSNPVKQAIPSQRTLEQFENVQGVVKKLKSLRPRHQENKRKRSVIDDTEGHVLPSGIPIPPLSPTIISSRPPSRSSPILAKPTAKRTSKRLRTADPSASEELFPLAALDNVEAKRLKLLEMSDWVGIERQRRMSKPVKMSFTDAKDRELIGRRRPLNSEKRGTVQPPRPMKIPLMTSYSEKRRGVHRGLADEYGSSDRVSIRIGSTGTTKGPDPDEILDRYQSPGLAHYDNAGEILKSQQQRRGVAHLSAISGESPEPFQSLFSPEEVKSPESFQNLFSQEEVEQSGIAQLVEAATIVEDENLPIAEDGLHLPESYHFPEPEPGFRLVFKQTPQPRGQNSGLSVGSSPIVRDFAFNGGQTPGAVIEQPARLEDRNVLKKQISELGPVEDGNPNTSPLSVATSRYIQELELQSFGSGGRKGFAKNTTNEAAIASVRPSVHGYKADRMRETSGDREIGISVKPNEVQAKENVQPAEDEDEIWRKFFNLDSSHDFQTIPDQHTSTHVPQAPTIIASLHDKQVLSSPKPTTQKAPPPSPDEDELIWRNFIFSDSDAIDHEWVIEEEEKEASSASPHDTQTSNSARPPPSMVAEVATSPLKQNPHLLDESLLDDSVVALEDDTSRYANVSTSTKSSPSIQTEFISRQPQQNQPYPPHAPTQPSPIPTTSPSTHDNQSTTSTNLPLPSKPNHPLPSNPSSLQAEASSSSNPTTNYSIQYLSPPINNPSSDELAWTPSRLPGPPQKIVFRKPARYVGERADPEPVHLGWKTSVEEKKRKGKGKGKGKTGLAEAVERAKGRWERRGGGGRDDGGDQGYGDEEVGEMEEDDIVDD